MREAGKQKRISRQQALFLRLLEKALSGDIRAASTIMSIVLKFQPKPNEQAAHDESISDDDNEIVADFFRRNAPSNS